MSPPDDVKPLASSEDVRRSGGRWWGGGRLLAVAVAGVVVGGLATVAVVGDRLTPISLTAAGPVAVILPVTSSTTNQATTAALKAVFDAPGQVVVRRSGVLTQLLVEPGGSLTDGEVVARVDGWPVVAMVAPAALHRSLGVGDRGPDVHQVQAWLRARGFLEAVPDGRYGAMTRAAVKAWERSLGLVPTGRFDLGLVAWVGPRKAVAADLQTSAGRSVAEGEVLMTTRPAVRAIQVSEPSGGITQDGPQVLEVAGVEVAYVLGSGRISDRKDAASIRAALGAATEGVGRIRPATEQRVKLVPASAVVTGGDGTTCVFASADAPATPVTVLGGGLGGVSVPVDLPLTTVLANPAEVRPDLTCD